MCIRDSPPSVHQARGLSAPLTLKPRRRYGPPICPRARYAMSGTDLRARYAMSGTDLRARYAMSGTELGYAATRRSRPVAPLCLPLRP
eukprot:2242347-Rhodomonas_salina.1